MAKLQLFIHARVVGASHDAGATIPPAAGARPALILDLPEPIRALLALGGTLDHGGDATPDAIGATVGAQLAAVGGPTAWGLSAGDPWIVDPDTGRWYPPGGPPNGAVFVLERDHQTYRHDLFLDQGEVTVEYEIGAMPLAD